MIEKKSTVYRKKKIKQKVTINTPEFVITTLSVVLLFDLSSTALCSWMTLTLVTRPVTCNVFFSEFQV